MPTLQFDYTLYFYPGIEDAKGRCMSTQLEINQSSAFQPDPHKRSRGTHAQNVLFRIPGAEDPKTKKRRPFRLNGG
jgi:hypothetical protein